MIQLTITNFYNHHNFPLNIPEIDALTSITLIGITSHPTKMAELLKNFAQTYKDIHNMTIDILDNNRCER